jgi:NADPH-dependent stearoyl-CoA 9-desaturase
MAIADVAEYTHLSVADIKGLADELDPTHRDVEDSRGAQDRAHIQRTIAFQRCLDLADDLLNGGGSDT